MTEYKWRVGFGPEGITGPTTPGDHYISVAGRIAKRKRREEWNAGDTVSPWPPHDSILITAPAEAHPGSMAPGHSDTVAMVIVPHYPSEEGMKEAERRARLIAMAPRMALFLEWAMGMSAKVWDSLPPEVRKEWNDLVISLPRR